MKVITIIAGSPPRMRGTPDRPILHFLELRITPAHAGNTEINGDVTKLDEDHPRACGEHRRRPSAPLPSLGSPPRMRGTPEAAKALERQIGITPAHAGNTLAVLMFSGQFQDHPRACGEHLCRIQRRGKKIGSPPRMRGTPNPHLTGSNVFRITPAHAGNT